MFMHQYLCKKKKHYKNYINKIIKNKGTQRKKKLYTLIYKMINYNKINVFELNKFILWKISVNEIILKGLFVTYLYGIILYFSKNTRRKYNIFSVYIIKVYRTI